MINLIMHGCNGAMGRVISAMAQEMDGIRIAAGVDLNTEKIMIIRYMPLWESVQRLRTQWWILLLQRQWTNFWITVWKRASSGAVYHRTYRRTVKKGRGCQQKDSGSSLCQYVSWCKSAFKADSGRGKGIGKCGL